MKPTIQQKIESGFALPIAIGVGVIMILIATTMVIRSNQSKVASISQRSSNKSLAAAETGVAQYIAFFNTYRELAKQVPGPNGDNWKNTRANLSALPGCSKYSAPEKLLDSFGSDFQIDEFKPNKGSFALEEYEIIGSEGVLTISGKDSDGTKPSITKLEVKIPIDPIDLKTTEASTVKADCGALATSIPINSEHLPFNNSLTDYVDSLTPTKTGPQVSLSPINKDEKLDGDQYTTYIIDVPPGSSAIELDTDEKIEIPAGKIFFLVTNGDITVNDGYFELGDDSKLFLISSGTVTLKSQASRPPISPLPVTSSSQLHIFLTNGDLLIEVNGRPKPIQLSAYAPFSTVRLRDTSPPGPAFSGEVWAKEFITTDAKTLEAEEDTLKILTEDPNIPSFWKNALNVNNFTHTRIRPINSWKQIKN